MFNKSSNLVAVISISAISFSSAYICWLYCKKLRKRKLPNESKWQHIGTLQQINLYPVKSCGALEVEEANTYQYGLGWNGCNDRNLLLLTDNDKVGFAGVHPELLSVKTEIISKNVLALSAPHSEKLIVDMENISINGKIVQKQMKGYRLQLVECKPEHHIWFSQAILQQDHGLRLFIALDPIIETSWWRKINYEFFPIMAIHKKSLQDLNSRLSVQNQVHHLQFRDNLLIESFPNINAYDEDNWLWLKIVGNNDDRCATILHFNSPCFRCILPNIDIKTCKRNVDCEPLKTLKTYRLNSHPKDPEMGVYFDVVQSGLIRKGDSVFVQYKTDI